MSTPASCRVLDGVLHLGERPLCLAATDYHYFRDDPANWEARLRAQKDAGLDVLSFYVPWRHHAPRDPVRGNGRYDFTGATQGNRDVRGLMELAADLDLKVLVKPGPFVHAELPYGGLPDYVDPAIARDIEPERDGDGAPVTWGIRGMNLESVRALPGPFDPVYNRYVRDWLVNLARALRLDRVWPRGPVVGVQLLNEGIYSDSSRAVPWQLGFSKSTLERYHDFMEARYGDLDAYNRCHGTRVAAWSEVDPPRRAHPLRAARDVLHFIDWSAFQADLYREVARVYKRYLEEGGLPEQAPVFFNFNPNGSTFRTQPATNDGWYTRVNVKKDEFTFGLTNWIGVVAGDEQTLRQFLMAATAARGPALELNWGFISLYEPPFRFTVTSHFESMVALACGATGVTAYTFAGTRAWRDDPNIAGEWIPERTNTRADASVADYPGEAPVLSTGERMEEYYALKQIAQWLRDEAPRFVRAGHASPLAWAVYPPYAWAGQWLARGDADDPLWLPELARVPRGAYHGLDAFVEMTQRHGASFRQVHLNRAEDSLDPYRVVCLRGAEFMDPGTQERLASFVEHGGGLVLSLLVPSKDMHMRPAPGALATRVFPHTGARDQLIEGTRVVTWDGEAVGFAQESVTTLTPPADVDALLRVGDDVVGYRRRVGAGTVWFAGFNLWRAQYSGDDHVIARANQDLAWRLVEDLGGKDALEAAPERAGNGVTVWPHGERGADARLLYVVNQDAKGDLGFRVKPADGLRERFTITTPSQAVHALVLEHGRVTAFYLKGVNDLRAEYFAPRIRHEDAEWGADVPCDVCVTREPDGRGLRVSVSSASADIVRVTVPVAADAVERVVSENGDAPRVRALGEDASEIAVRDVRDAGTYRIILKPGRRVVVVPA